MMSLVSYPLRALFQGEIMSVSCNSSGMRHDMQRDYVTLSIQKEVQRNLLLCTIHCWLPDHTSVITSLDLAKNLCFKDAGTVVEICFLQNLQIWLYFAIFIPQIE